MATAKKTQAAQTKSRPSTKKPVFVRPAMAEADKTQEKETIRKKFSGVVVSNKMAKTIVVKVETVKIHPKYQKRFVVNRKYKVHDEKEQYKPGQTVSFISCRPLSKDKKWRVAQ